MIWLTLAWAAEVGVVYPGVESAEMPAAYEAWAKKSRLRGAQATLLCEPFVNVWMCFSREENGLRSYVTAAEVAALPTLRQAAVRLAQPAITLLEPSYVDGFTPRYFAAVGQPAAHAALLSPEALELKVGGKCVVAVPVRGVLLAWVPGDLDFDKAMAVGARRMYDTLPNPVSPSLYAFDGAAWTVWGEAQEVPPPVVPD